jgi:hypothetical protein
MPEHLEVIAHLENRYKVRIREAYVSPTEVVWRAARWMSSSLSGHWGWYSGPVANHRQHLESFDIVFTHYMLED